MASFRKHGKLWYFRYIAFVDGKNKQIERKGHFDKPTTQIMAREAEHEASELRKSFKDPYYANVNKPLKDHLADWHADMLAHRKTTKHADQYRDRASNILALVAGKSLGDLELGRSVEALKRIPELVSDALSCARFSQVTFEGIQTALSVLHTHSKSGQTVNHHRAAVRAFMRWCKDKKRTHETFMDGVESYAVDPDEVILINFNT